MPTKPKAPATRKPSKAEGSPKQAPRKPRKEAPQEAQAPIVSFLCGEYAKDAEGKILKDAAGHRVMQKIERSVPDFSLIAEALPSALSAAGKIEDFSRDLVAFAIFHKMQENESKPYFGVAKIIKEQASKNDAYAPAAKAWKEASKMQKEKIRKAYEYILKINKPKETKAPQDAEAPDFTWEAFLPMLGEAPDHIDELSKADKKPLLRSLKALFDALDPKASK